MSDDKQHQCALHWCTDPATHVWDCKLEMYTIEMGFCDEHSQYPCENDPHMEYMDEVGSIVEPRKRNE